MGFLLMATLEEQKFLLIKIITSMIWVMKTQRQVTIKYDDGNISIDLDTGNPLDFL